MKRLVFTLLASSVLSHAINAESPGQDNLIVISFNQADYGLNMDRVYTAPEAWTCQNKSGHHFMRLTYLPKPRKQGHELQIVLRANAKKQDSSSVKEVHMATMDRNVPYISDRAFHHFCESTSSTNGLSISLVSTGNSCIDRKDLNKIQSVEFFPSYKKFSEWIEDKEQTGMGCYPVHADIGPNFNRIRQQTDFDTSPSLSVEGMQTPVGFQSIVKIGEKDLILGEKQIGYMSYVSHQDILKIKEFLIDDYNTQPANPRKWANIEAIKPSDPQSLWHALCQNYLVYNYGSTDFGIYSEPHALSVLTWLHNLPMSGRFIQNHGDEVLVRTQSLEFMDGHKLVFITGLL